MTIVDSKLNRSLSDTSAFDITSLSPMKRHLSFQKTFKIPEKRNPQSEILKYLKKKNMEHLLTKRLVFDQVEDNLLYNIDIDSPQIKRIIISKCIISTM